ncbi:MAG TPA: aminotransferase class III-fold pyridoxal phosphate-dependent enzyme, partial [Gemmatimonadetes bacterium]|nr:aminotransferase class III-fold pyridoxal phosphate-dependent enzyme [Gemmatimonadota bacterium]
AGLLTVPAGDNVVRLLPPLNIEESHIDEAVGILDQQSPITGVLECANQPRSLVVAD